MRIFIAADYTGRAFRKLYLYSDYKSVNDYGSTSTGRGTRSPRVRDRSVAEEGRFTRAVRLMAGGEGLRERGDPGEDVTPLSLERRDCKSGFEVTVYANTDDGHARLPR